MRVSATPTPDVDTITTLLLHSPATVEIGESADGDGQSALRQFWLRCSHADKFLVMYALFKLNRRQNPRDVPRVSTRGATSRAATIVRWPPPPPPARRRIPGRSLIFVNSVERGFRLKLFLEQFGVTSGLLNCELPLESRWHCIQA